MSYPRDSKGRYLRIPTPRKAAKQNSNRKVSYNLIKSHKRFITWYQDKLGLSDYGLLWLVFLKGVLLAIIIERLIIH